MRFLHVLCVPFLILGIGGRPSAKEVAPPRFVEVAQEAGLALPNVFGENNTKYILETTGTGLALFDYDSDGKVDVYLVNGWRFGGLRPGERPRSALFRNRGDGAFVDVTEEAGVGGSGWGQGAVAADVDNDGDADLFVTYYGPNALYRNEGNGRFADATTEAGVGGEPGWYSTACAFADVDRDGCLDLFVANYVPFDSSSAPLPGTGPWTTTRGVPTSAAPEFYRGQPCALYHNNGDGTFADVSTVSGIGGHVGRSLGAIFLDYDKDGWPDLYVANDAMANFLFHNRRDGTFEEVGTEMGAAYSEGGVAAGSMGAAAGDYDGDGWPDLVVANYEDQAAALYHNEKGQGFTDVAFPAGIGADTLLPLQWGALFFDYDNDGCEDLFFANGHITSALEAQYPRSSFAQGAQLFRNRGDGTFENVSDTSGEGLQVRRSGRGAACGDLDDDGDLDLLVVNRNDLPTLLRNDGGNKNHWLTVKLVGGAKTVTSPKSKVQSQTWDLGLETWDSGLSNRDGIGARVRVVAGGKAQIREVRAGSSYLSQSDIRVHFGLGAATQADTVEVQWPAGGVSRAANVAADRFLIVEEGRGIVAETGPRPAR